MKKLLVFVGDGGSGKTTMISELTVRYPERFKKVVTCTSRPQRGGEIDGIDYHFLPEKYFSDNREDLVLVKETTDGFFYGTRRLDLFLGTHHLLLTSKPTGIAKLVSLGRENLIVVRLAISEELKVERMRQRGDTEEAISRRLLQDAESRSDCVWGLIPVIELDACQDLDTNISIVLGRVDG